MKEDCEVRAESGDPVVYGELVGGVVSTTTGITSKYTDDTLL